GCNAGHAGAARTAPCAGGTSRGRARRGRGPRGGGPARASRPRTPAGAAPGRTACTPRSARPPPGSRRRRTGKARPWSSVGKRELQRVEPPFDCGELLEAPCRTLIEQRDSGPDDAIGVARVLGRLEPEGEEPCRRAAP